MSATHCVLTNNPTLIKHVTHNKYHLFTQHSLFMKDPAFTKHPSPINHPALNGTIYTPETPNIHQTNILYLPHALHSTHCICRHTSPCICNPLPARLRVAGEIARH